MQIRTKYLLSHTVALAVLGLFIVYSQVMLSNVSDSLESIKTDRLVRERLILSAKDSIYAMHLDIISAAMDDAEVPDLRNSEQLDILDTKARDFYRLLARLESAFPESTDRLRELRTHFQSYFLFAKRRILLAPSMTGEANLDVIELFQQRRQELLEQIADMSAMFTARLDQEFVNTKARLDQISESFSLLIMGGSLFTLILSVLLSRVLAKPIQDLKGAVSMVERVGYSTTIPVRSSDELGDLAKSFNRMVLAIKDKQESLARAEERYRSIFENSVEGIFQTTADGKILAVNPAQARIIGFSSPEQMMEESGMVPGGAYVNQEDRKRLFTLMAQGELVHDFEVPMRRLDGSLFWARIHARPVFDDKGQLSHINGIMEDITEAKAAREELEAYREQLEEMVRQRTSELSHSNDQLERAVSHLTRLNNRLQGLVDNSPAAIYLLDEKGREVLSNARFLDICRSLGTLPGDPAPHDSRDRAILAPLEQEALQKRKPVHGETTLSMDSGSRVLSMSVFPILGERGEIQGICGMLTDVTRDKLMQMEAMHASQLASIGELAAGVAHEINNPITGIINYAQILQDMASTRPKALEICTRIKNEGERVATITRSLLSFSRKPRERRRSVRLCDILEEALHLTKAQLSRNGIQLHVDCPHDLPPVMVNFTAIQQVIINLITNARHALMDSGKENRLLDIRARTTTGQEHTMLRLTMADNGAGIPGRHVPHLFDPFFTTKKKGRGTGLGLYICHRILTEHHGAIIVDSQKGEGAVFHVDLPLA